MNHLWGPQIAQRQSQSVHNFKDKCLLMISNTIYYYIWVLEMIFYNLFVKLDLKISKFYPKIMTWRNFNLPWFSLNILSLVKNITPPHYCDPHLTHGDHTLNKLEFFLHEDASTRVQAFLADRFLRRKLFSIYFYVEIRPSPPDMAPTLHRISWFEQSWICFTCECRCIRFRF